jgi:putative copper export protein/mono/diheme cytochrome c family protein
VLLEGTFVFWCFIAWRSDRRYFALAWASLIAAFVSGGAWLVVVASHMSGMPLESVIQGGVINVVLMQTRFGTAWLIRAALMVVIAISLVVQARTGKRAATWVGLLAASAFIAGLAWAGHGAAADDVPFDFLHAPADILHLLAAGAWLGALVPLVILLAQTRHDASPQAVSLGRTATLRFSVLGLTCVGTLIVTGIVNTWFLAGNVPALLGTLYGQLLLVKVALFAFMIAAAGINQRRLVPLLGDATTDDRTCLQAIGHVCRNASVEAAVGVFVLAVVGIIGILPPGAHTEPRWPLPFRFDLSEVPPNAQPVLDIAVIACVLCLIVVLVVAERKRYREMAAAIALLVVSGIVAFVALRPGIVEAYPTSFYASTQAYAAPSIARGAPLYAQNCIVCHGVSGRGDGPLAGKLPIRPADLTQAHLFAHKVGEMYWWIGNGKGGVMPGFAHKLSRSERWDVINFVLARAAGDLVNQTGPHIGAASAPPLPDFAFEQNGTQNTLSQMLKSGPALVVLVGSHASRSRLAQLAALQPRLATAGLHVVAVQLSATSIKAPLIVGVSNDVRSTLALFHSRADGGETELMLDRGGNVRARWTVAGAGGLAGAGTLLADATLVAKIPVAAANHAGHGG